MDRFRIKVKNDIMSEPDSDGYNEMKIILEIRLLKRNCFGKYIWREVSETSFHKLYKAGILTKNQAKIFLIEDFKTKRKCDRKKRNLYKQLNK